MTEMTPETQNATIENLRKLARLIEMDQPLHAEAVAESILLCASAWEAERKRAQKRYEELEQDFNTMRQAKQARIEALEIKAARWLALASPMWVGDESEGHFVCLACNQRGTDDGGTKTIRHIPDCEYAAALATTIVTSSDQNGSALAAEKPE
jgi:hypothetical protein